MDNRLAEMNLGRLIELPEINPSSSRKYRHERTIKNRVLKTPPCSKPLLDNHLYANNTVFATVDLFWYSCPISRQHSTWRTEFGFEANTSFRIAYARQNHEEGLP